MTKSEFLAALDRLTQAAGDGGLSAPEIIDALVNVTEAVRRYPARDRR